MKNKITRRKFIKRGAVLGVSTSIGTKGISKMIEETISPISKQNSIDVAVTTGADYYESTKKTIEIFGGMSNFVSNNASVLLLGNVWRIPGTYTKPGIFQAIAQLCWAAGAKRITCVSMMPRQNWEITGNAAALENEGVEIKLFNYQDYSQYNRIPIPSGILLKKAEIIKEFFTHDVFINVPICKHHSETVFSCTMKNLMGLSSYRSNREFHIEQNDHNIDKAQYLAQCIADLNTVIVPALNVVDATEFIVTNGPMGPGRIIKPQKIVVGVDRIAVDAYCITLLDKTSNDVMKIRKGYEHGLGEINLSKIRVKEEKL